MFRVLARHSTIPVNNNPADAICGYYVDANGVNHGFLRNSLPK
jgi:hypothetical protein